MYGNVDAAIKFFKTLTTHLADKNRMKLTQSKVDACIFDKMDDADELTIFISVTVDDCAITGKNQDIEWIMDNVEKRFKITRNGVITKHLGVEYEWGEMENGKRYCKATMNKKAEALIDSYEKYIGKEAKIYRTPGIPHETLQKHDGDPIDIDQYRSFVGQVMFFTTKVSIKAGAVIQVLSSYMSNPGPAHWKALGCLV